jgi:hypothetical protein
LEPLPLGHPKIRLYHIEENEHKDRHLLYVPSEVALSISMLDDREVERKGSVPFPYLVKKATINGPIYIELPIAPHGAALLVSAQTPEKLDEVFVLEKGTRAKEITDPIKDMLSIIPDGLWKVYQLPAFHIAVKPCGVVNAFSSPDIVLCSELLAALSRRGLAHAIMAIEAHEMAHSLMSLWKMPGNNNEDMADEFAAAILGRVVPEAIAEMMQFLDSVDPVEEAALQIQHGNRHTLSIQRARNLREALNNLSDVSDRWFSAIAPYKR